ncbi:UDP-N-acetylmuramoyl-tripeptide--D-alanyl-D-alanine ligase [Psychroserpens sp. BH13MA-6]
MNLETIYDYFLTCDSVCTDTRKITKNCMFFALKGDHFNGNEFAEEAIQKGASYAIIDENIENNNEQCIVVDNVLITLQRLANYHRKRLNVPIISLTGSNGKTTTKELINSVLSTTYNTLATQGNLNNHIGVPLTLLRLTSTTEIAIVEMGANHQKEIEFLCGIAQPDYGLITNFGKAHLEGFGGIDGVIKGKSELYDYLKANQKTVFINTDDKKQMIQIGNYTNVSTYGMRLDNDCVITFDSANPNVSLIYDDIKIDSQLIGDYNFGNIAVAVAIGKYFDVPSESIKQAIENYQPKNNRSEIIEKGDNKIVLDAYNANPTSMLAALQNFKQLRAEKKYLFLGDMFELGAHAEIEHQRIVDFLERHFEAQIFIIGQNFKKTISKESTHAFSSFEDLQPILKTLDLHNATVLIKGSRGMALERILNFI